MGKIAGVIVRKIAEGDFGEIPKNLYWALAGKKTIIGAVLAGAYGAVSYMNPETCPFCVQAQEYIKWTGAFFLSVGLLDGALRLEPPTK